MKNFNSNNQKLQECLAKGITTCELRNTLTKFGILENESVTVFLKRGDEVLASSEIEPTSGNNQLERLGRSLKTFNTEAFNTEIVNEFLTPTEELFGLGETILNMDETTNKTSQLSLEFRNGKSTFARACVYLSCGNCPTGQQCCWKNC